MTLSAASLEVQQLTYQRRWTRTILPMFASKGWLASRTEGAQVFTASFHSLDSAIEFCRGR